MKSRNLTKSLLIINDVKEKQQRLEIRLDLRSLAMKVWEKFLIDLEFLISYQDHICCIIINKSRSFRIVCIINTADWISNKQR